MSYAVDCPVDCRYRSRPTCRTATVVTCDFILIAGHSRGCAPKPYCECYRQREKKKQKRVEPENWGLGKAQDRKPWDHEKGYRLFKLKMTTKQIAAELKISESAVHHRRQRYWNKGTP